MLEGAHAFGDSRRKSVAFCLHVSPLIPLAVGRAIMPGVRGVRNGSVETYLLYFTDFHWLPDAMVADVISTARIRGS